MSKQCRILAHAHGKTLIFPNYLSIVVLDVNICLDPVFVSSGDKMRGQEKHKQCGSVGEIRGKLNEFPAQIY